MKNKQLVESLQARGYIVKYQEHKGNVKITSITNESKTVNYRGAKGNAVARQILKGLPEEPINLRSYKHKIKEPRKHLPPLDKDVEKLLRKVQRIWRMDDDMSEKKLKKGKILKSDVRKNLELYGKEEVMKQLWHNFYYAKKLVYPERVEFLLQRMQASMDVEPDGDYKILNKIMDLLQSKIGKMTSDQFQDILAAWYDRNEAISKGEDQKTQDKILRDKIKAIL